MSSIMRLYEWFIDNPLVLWGFGIFSAVMFITTLVAIPFIVARIPTDYFIRPHRPHPHGQREPARLCWLICKNMLGFMLVLAGLAMLVLPGQGVLTILIGIMLMNFPGKYELERYIIQQPTVLKALNWIRDRANRPALIVESPAKKEEAVC